MSNFQIPPRYEALAAQYEELTACRIVLQEKSQYRLISPGGEQPAVVSGKYQYEAASPSDYPAVGDYVMADLNDGGIAVIHHLLPRTSVFLRKAAGSARQEQVVAANVDTLFLCMSLNNDFNLRRLERYLSVAWDSGSTPVIVLTKSDLCEDIPAKLSQVESVAFGVDILVTTAMEKDGYEKVLAYVKPGRTVAFIGSSGVGKSTLINRLIGQDTLATNGLRNDDKGRHTTTHRELIFLPGGGMVIDTPGMRELGMWDSTGGVEQTFRDIEALAAQCRFSNCSHQTEPGCAVRAALESGELTAERFASYQKLLQENAYAADSESYLASKEKKFKEISKINKRSKKR
ncbi:MAG: ribosome small subunit-dependent GTPase A [Gemmiger sp.]